MGKQRPKHQPWEEKIVVFMSINALVQLVLDIIFEALHLLPTRINHLSLTFLNAFISFKTLSAVQKNRFSFMHEDCQILWLMEICLIFGDVWYAIFDDFSIRFIYIRLIFIVCSFFNFICVSYFMAKYELWSITYKGHGAMRRLSVDFSASVRRLSFDLFSQPKPEDSAAVADLPVQREVSAAERAELDCTIRTDAQMDLEMQMSDDEEANEVEMRDTTNAFQGASYCAGNESPFSKNQEVESDVVVVDKPGGSSAKLL